MSPLFIFGTLCHGPLLEAVIGKTEHLTTDTATLPDFEVSQVLEGPFPTISACSGQKADGLLVNGLTPDDFERLEFYEAAFNYQLETVTLDDGQRAVAYFPEPGIWTHSGPWSLDDWASDWGALSIVAAQEVMSYFGQRSPAEVGAMFPMIRARAGSYLNAQRSQHGHGTLAGQVDVANQRRAYANYFALDEYRLRHEKFDGTLSDEVLRAVFLAPDAALVLPYDPHRDTVLVVEQMRMGPLARGDQHLWQLEPIAGRLDPGEKPQTAARREALEEAGLSLRELETVAEAYCSPGNSSEFFYIYVGLADLPDTVIGTGGLEVEDEDIRSHVLDFERLLEMCETMQIANAPLVMTTYWLSHHRERLRAQVGVSG